jgi:hypothetical protein
MTAHGEQTSRLDDLTGAHGQPFVMPVERGKIREFARATGTRDSAYLDEGEPVIPPTFLMTARYWQQQRHLALGDVRLDGSRALHGEQAFTFHGPLPRAGEELTGQQRVESVEHKKGKRGGELTLVTIVTEFRDSTGALRAEGRATLVQTSEAVGGGA